MSAKNRGKRVNAFAFYPTDPRLVRGLLAAIESGEGAPLHGLNMQPECGRTAQRMGPAIWCDPCAGDGAIVRAVEGYRAGGRIWMTSDLNPNSVADEIGDFREPHVARGADVYLTNPPYTDEEDGDDLVLAFAEGCVEKRATGGEVILLVRFGFFTALRRLKFIRESGPWDSWPLAPRPSFGLNAKGKKGNDATEYVWIRQGPGSTGRQWNTIDWRSA